MPVVTEAAPLSDTTPWRVGEPLPVHEVASLRREMALSHFKWDPQVGDTTVLGDRPIILARRAWRELEQLAEALDTELLAAEAEILHRPELLGTLGLPRPITRLLQRATAHPRGPRVTRYDFHHTQDGWRVSEANSDVPGGYVEASAYTRLVADRFGLEPTGDPAAALVDTVARGMGPHGPVALVHATAYSDDAQVMHLLARAFADRGTHAVVCGPATLPSPCAHALRFFPAEWLPALGRKSGWQRHFIDDALPQTNPATALVSQSKRWTLLWDRLRTPLPAWRALCPPAHEVEPLTEPLHKGRVYKPALGRVGEGVILAANDRPPAHDREARRSRRALRADRAHRTAGLPGRWLAQDRFTPAGITDANGIERAVCLGVYVIDGTAAGVYGRVATGEIVDQAAIDTPVLLEPEGGTPWR
ncbi:MAG: hypothetical protein NCW75_10715 [Phycisphaera sp.]|nr:MAG: hypothetical protein NCW75_10715 [Phycisphaera sp.]